MIALILACAGGAEDSGPRVEGATGGDCRDGADNDQDGLFDCDDDGCSGSPDCEAEGDADADADADSDADGDADSDSDTDPEWTVCGDGSGAWLEIQDAVDAAADGDTITVCAGTYDAVEMSDCELTLEGADRDTTIIDGGSQTGMTVTDCTLTLSGFTFTGEAESISGTGGLLVTSSTVVGTDLRFTEVSAAYSMMQQDSHGDWDRLRFEDNDATTNLVAQGTGSFVLRHSIFTENNLDWQARGGALIAVMTPSYEVSNNLFADNLAHGNATSAYFSWSIGFSAWVYNNVWYGNDNGGKSYHVNPNDGVLFENNIVMGITGGGVIAYSNPPGVAYNDSWGNTDDNWATNTGQKPTNNLEADPRFVDPAKGDFHLKSGFSPCENAGNPLAGYNDTDGTRNDMGIYGGPYGDWD